MSTKTLYVGNLPYSVSEDDLLEHFGPFNPKNPMPKIIKPLTRKNLHGVWSALIIPWTDRDEVDSRRFVAEVRSYAGTGVHWAEAFTAANRTSAAKNVGAKIAGTNRKFFFMAAEENRGLAD